MNRKRVIAVVGATGAQGGGLARAILADRQGEFAVRALTRDVRSPQAQELARAGAELAAFDIDDPESIRRAFEGAWGAFCVTFYWAHFSPERETAHARNFARAARDAGVQHTIWSTLEDTRRWIPIEDARMPTLMGRYKVPHFDSKGEADHSFTDLKVPVTFLLTSFYWENFIHFGMGPQRDRAGSLRLAMPLASAKLPGIAAEDIGRCAYTIFRERERWLGKTVGIAADHLTGSELAQALSNGLGERVTYDDMPPAAYRALGFPGADDLGNMYQFKVEFNDYFCGIRDTDVTRSLHPGLLSLHQWLAIEASRIPMKATPSSAVLRT